MSNNEDKKIRVKGLAEVLGMTSTELRAKCKDAGIGVEILKGPRSVIPAELEKEIRRTFDSPDLFKQPSSPNDGQVIEKAPTEEEEPDESSPNIDLTGSYISMDARDLRDILCYGYLGSNKSYYPEHLKSIFDSSGNWIDANSANKFLHSEGGIPGMQEEFVCLVRLPDTDAFKSQGIIPASSLSEVIFTSEKFSSDFKTRNSVMSIPDKHLNYNSCTALSFKQQDEQSFFEEEKHECFESILKGDRILGAFGAYLQDGEMTEEILSFLSTSLQGNTNAAGWRNSISGLIQLVIGTDSENVATQKLIDIILELLSEAKWSQGFSGIEMLNELCDRYSDRSWLIDSHDSGDVNLVDSYYERLRTAVLPGFTDILSDTKLAPPKLLMDGGDILLRSLLLVLRTIPLSLAELEKWDSLEPAPQSKVRTIARILTGWYEGFSLQTQVKQDSALYRFCTRALVNIANPKALNPPLDLHLNQTADLDYDRVIQLFESSDCIAKVVVKPDDAILELYHAVRQILGDSNDAVLNPGTNEIVVTFESVEITGSISECGQYVKWLSSYELPLEGNAWQKSHYEAIAKIAQCSHCALYTTEEYPICNAHFYQLRETNDQPEMEWHLEELSKCIAQLREVFCCENEIPF